ncbi:putative transposase IS891/IS1136/IS1341 domain-containing protein [Paenibacillus alkaliterrae]
MNERLSEKNRSHPFKLPSKEKSFVSYNFLDALFKVMDQIDYRALPAQSSQGIMKIAFQNWLSFFASMKDYRKHPGKYKGKPNVPGYAHSKVKEVVFSNQDCVIKEQKYLKLPKTKLQLNIGKLGCTGGQLKQVRVVPSHGRYVVEMVFSYPIEKKEAAKENALAIDLGIENLATIVTTTGSKPMLVKGKMIKAMNQYYNKMKAHYIGILRQGKKPCEGTHTSSRLERLHLKRHHRIKDLFHKVSRHIVKMAVEQQIGTIVIG